MGQSDENKQAHNCVHGPEVTANVLCMRDNRFLVIVVVLAGCLLGACGVDTDGNGLANAQMAQLPGFCDETFSLTCSQLEGGDFRIGPTQAGLDLDTGIVLFSTQETKFDIVFWGGGASFPSGGFLIEGDAGLDECLKGLDEGLASDSHFPTSIGSSYCVLSDEGKHGIVTIEGFNRFAPGTMSFYALWDNEPNVPVYDRGDIDPLRPAYMSLSSIAEDIRFVADSSGNDVRISPVLDADQNFEQVELSFEGKAPFDLQPCDGINNYLITEGSDRRVFCYLSAAEASYIQFELRDANIFFDRSFGNVPVVMPENEVFAGPPVLSVEYETS